MEIQEKIVCKWLKVQEPREGRICTVGVMVGVPIDGPNGEKLFNADYSVCNEEYDEFDRDLAWRIAYGRAKACRPARAKKRVVKRVHSTWYGKQMRLSEEFADFCLRCRTYFKDREPAGKAEAVLDGGSAGAE